MVTRKSLRELIRSRRKNTNERFATARREVLRRMPPGHRDASTPCHFPGNVPAATALRGLLAHSGVRDPHTGEPFSEAMVFGLAGGIGAGMLTFLYEKEDFASFFVAGRHLWQDDLAYVLQACQRLGLEPEIKESSGGKTAEKQLREMLENFGICIAWVDAAHLPHRAMPAYCSGGGYHVVTIYRIDDASGTALVGDLAENPVAVPLADLTVARARIKKQKNRLLAVPPSEISTEKMDELVQAAIRKCHEGLTVQRMRSFTLQSIQDWGERMHLSTSKESWERVFTRGKRLYSGLTMMYDCIEYHGTGGGLCRPIFADFLLESAKALNDSWLRSLGDRYAELGRSWSALAMAALPEDVPLLREARELHDQKAELLATDAPQHEVAASWQRLGELAKQAKESFPLGEREGSDLRASLQARILQLYEAEAAALEVMAKAAA